MFFFPIESCNKPSSNKESTNKQKIIFCKREQAKKTEQNCKQKDQAKKKQKLHHETILQDLQPNVN
jgi:hypothetical protein